MSSPRPAKSPKKPILIPKTTKVNSSKPNLSTSSTTPRKITPKKSTSPRPEVPALRPPSQRDRKIGVMQEIKNSQGLESPRSPRNSSMKSLSPTQSGQVSPKKDSPESLRRQINDQTKFTLQQSKLIKKLHTDLVRAELVTGNAAPNSSPSDSQNQYTNLGLRLDFLIENYINMNNKLKQLEGGQNENQPNNQNDDATKKALQADEICKSELGLNYTIDQLKEILQHKQEPQGSENVVARNVDLSFVNDFDNELGKSMRGVFNNETDNDNIVNKVKELKGFAESVRGIFNKEDNDEAILRTIQSNKDSANDNSTVAELTSRLQQLAGNPEANIEPTEESVVVQNLNKQHKQEMDEKESQIIKLNQEIDEFKKQLDNQGNEIQNLNITLDNNNKERVEERENLEKQLNQKAEELANAYKQIERNGLETDQQRKDRELSSKVREVFVNDPDDQITGFIRKDIGLASTIRGIYQSGDDNYIIDQVRQAHNELPQIRGQLDNLRNELDVKQKVIDQKDAEVSSLQQSNTEKQQAIDQKDKELNELKQACSDSNNLGGQIVQLQKELEAQIMEKNNAQSEINRLNNEISRIKSENNQREELFNEQADESRNEINSLKMELDQKQQAINELINKIDDPEDQKNKEITYLKGELLKALERIKELETTEQPIDGNISLQDFNEVNQKLLDSQNKLNVANEELDKIKSELKHTSENAEEIIKISKQEYDRLQSDLKAFIEKAQAARDQGERYVKRIEELRKENEELKQENEEFIKDSESNLIEFKKENEETVNFANQVRSIFESKDTPNIQNYSNIRDNDKEIIELIKNLRGNSNFYEQIGHLFHKDASEKEIKEHAQKVAAAAHNFHNLPLPRDALNDLFNEASGKELEDLVEQMKNDQDESIRKNAEILSDALKDSRMTVEAEGMIATTLAMFLQQMSDKNLNQ